MPDRTQPGKHHACAPGTAITGLWDHCGEFPLGLPMTFRFNPAGSPVGAVDFEAAVRGAAAAWNTPLAGLGMPNSGVFTIAGTTSKGLSDDGVNVIMFGDPATCSTPGAIAVMCPLYEGETGTGRHRIREVDIVIDPERAWFQATGIEELQGVVTGTAWLANNPWLDLQSAITHELGHALGLEHIGNPATANDITDAGKHVQTMYRRQMQGETHKRTLDVGDILGLMYVLENT